MPLNRSLMKTIGLAAFTVISFGVWCKPASAEDGWIKQRFPGGMPMFVKSEKIDDDAYQVIFKTVVTNEKMDANIQTFYEFDCKNRTLEEKKTETYVDGKLDPTAEYSSSPVKMQEIKDKNIVCNQDLGKNIVNYFVKESEKAEKSGDYRKKAYCTAAKIDVNNFRITMEHSLANNGKYPKLQAKFISNRKYYLVDESETPLTLSKNVTITTIKSTGKFYKVKATHANCDKAYVLSSDMVEAEETAKK